MFEEKDKKEPESIAQPSGLQEKIHRLPPIGVTDDHLFLQRQVGNAAVQNEVDSSVENAPVQDSRADTASRYLDAVNSALSENEAIEPSPETKAAIEHARGNGQPLDSAVRAEMEPFFWADFGDVRVHANFESDRLAQEIGARAFATGSDIFFRNNEYRSDSVLGRELIAHELAHVIADDRGRQSENDLLLGTLAHRIRYDLKTLNRGPLSDRATLSLSRASSLEGEEGTVCKEGFTHPHGGDEYHNQYATYIAEKYGDPTTAMLDYEVTTRNRERAVFDHYFADANEFFETKTRHETLLKEDWDFQKAMVISRLKEQAARQRRVVDSCSKSPRPRLVWFFDDLRVMKEARNYIKEYVDECRHEPWEGGPKGEEKLVAPVRYAVLKKIPWQPTFDGFAYEVSMLLYRNYCGEETLAAIQNYLWLSNLEAVTYKSLKSEEAPGSVTLRVKLINDPTAEDRYRFQFELLDFSVAGEETARATALLGSRQWRLQFGDYSFDFPVEQAIRYIENCIEAVLQGIRYHRALNEDQWVISFWSEVFGGAEIPSTETFSKALTHLAQARKYVEETRHFASQERMDVAKATLALAEMEIDIAAGLFNLGNRRWHEYKQKVLRGAAAGIRVCEIAIIVLSAPAGGGKGVGVVRAALSEAGMAAYSETALQIGSHYFAGDPIDLARIIEASGTEFVASLVGGKLKKLFLDCANAYIVLHRDKVTVRRIVAEISGGVKGVSETTGELAEQGLNLALKGTIEDFRDKPATLEEFTQRLVDRAADYWANSILENVK